MVWAAAKLQWNKDRRTFDELLDEFYAKMYGSAAGTMKQFFDHMEAAWNAPRTVQDQHVGAAAERVAQAASVSPEAIEKGIKLLEKAKNEAGKGIEQERIDITLQGMRYIRGMILQYHLATMLSQTGIADLKGARRLLNIVKRWGSIVRETGHLHETVSGKDNLLSGVLRGFQRSRLPDGTTLLERDRKMLDYPAFFGMIALLEWFRKNDPRALATYATELGASLPESELGDVIRGYLWVIQNRPASLLVNSQFDTDPKAGKGMEAQQPHPGSWGVPPG